MAGFHSAAAIARYLADARHAELYAGAAASEPATVTASSEPTALTTAAITTANCGILGSMIATRAPGLKPRD